MATTPAAGGVGGGNGEEPPVVGVQPDIVEDEGGDDGAQGQQGHEEIGNEAPELVPGRVVTAEERHLLTLFPEEVWLRILDNLKDEPRTLLNCVNASSLFRRLLKPTQPTWMFGMIFPHVVDYLTKNQILACRRTGRDWNKAVDTYLHENRKLRPFDEATYRAADTGDDPGDAENFVLPRILGGQARPSDYEFEDEAKITQFMESVGGTPGRNPFIDRSVGIYCYFYGRRGAPLTFWPTVFRFLDEFGKHIWYFRLGAALRCRDGRTVNGRLLQLLRGCLSRLPNLRRLRLYVTVNLDPTDHLSLRNNLGNVDDDALTAYLDGRPLPMIPTLETLYFEVWSQGPRTLCEHLVALHRNQLKMIKFNRINVLTVQGGLPMLTEFHWSPRTANLDDVENVFFHLKTSPLGKLRLVIHSVEDHIDFDRLFGLISDNFGNTLRILDLAIWLIPLVVMAVQLDHPGRQEVNATARLGTPHLKALHLTGNCFQQLRIDFLLDVAFSLQYLNLRHMAGSQRAEPDPKEELDIHEYVREGHLYESNVWIRLPKLKRLGVQFGMGMRGDDFSRFYHRETYQALERGE